MRITCKQAHKSPEANSLATALNAQICIVSPNTKKEVGKKESLPCCRNSSQKGRRQAKGSSLHASHERSTFPQWIQKSILDWLLKPDHAGVFFPVTSCPNKSHFRRYRHCCWGSFLPGPVQCEPIYFSSHIPRLFFPLSFWLIESVRLSYRLKENSIQRKASDWVSAAWQRNGEFSLMWGILGTRQR